MAAVVQKWTSEEARGAAAGIVRALRDSGFTAYFAGGCVRDELLGHEPVDYDVATDARPDAVGSLFRRTAAVGASFGVVLVQERGVTVEVASFRSDGPYSDKRRPDHVEYSDAEHDAQRRDFTINALFLDPFVEGDTASGVIDHVGGLADLRAGVIRAVGDPERRLAEDHLRALRAVRFAARYGFEIEAGTAQAITRHARDLEGVSRERIGEEFRRMLGHPSRAGAVEMLNQLGLDTVLLGSAGPAGDRAISRLGDHAVGVTLACLALDRGRVESASQTPGLVREWRRALCLSNEESAALRDTLSGVLELERGWDGLGVAAKKRRAASGWFAGALAVVWARDAARGSVIGAEVMRLASDGVGLAPEPMVGGEALKGLGMEPGPVFARVLRGVYDAQLEGRVADQASALRLARELAAGGGV